MFSHYWSLFFFPKRTSWCLCFKLVNNLAQYREEWSLNISPWGEAQYEEYIQSSLHYYPLYKVTPFSKEIVCPVSGPTY